MNQDYHLWDVRAAAILTDAYVAGTVISPLSGANPGLRNQLNLLIAFTIGSLTSAEIKVEFSHDGTTYFQDTFESISGAESTLSLGNYKLTATGNYVISIPIKFNYIKISAKGTGTVTNSSMKIQAVIGTV
jgi:hypothetical protein